MEISLNKLARLLPDADLELNDKVHEIFSFKASEICNQGTDKMIAFLKDEGFTDEQIFEITEG